MPPRRADDPLRPAAVLLEPDSARYRYEDFDLPECPDLAPTGAWEMRGRFWEGSFSEHNGRAVLEGYQTRYYANKQALCRQVRRLRESVPGLKESGYDTPKKVRLREGGTDWFGYGLNGPPPIGGGLTTPYIPLIPGPWTRQMYWADMFAMSAKAFEAYQHNPLAHRAVEISTEFVIGRGVECKAKTERGQQVWEDFWKLNHMDERLEAILGDLSVYGEIFLRYFANGGSLSVRSLDPAGIYEVVTDQEDWESVYFYHQQEQERAQLYAPPAGNIAPTGPTERGAVTRYTIRQIPAQEVDHYRINVRSGEVRGRSDLFPALGYLKRLQDLLTARVIKADMEARMVYDLMVNGTIADVNANKAALSPKGNPPEPGSIFAHNQQVTLAGVQFKTGSESGESSAVDEIVQMCALGMGISAEYLWQGSKTGATRANALVATEPGQKRFQRRQRLVERILSQMYERVCDAARLQGEDREMEFTFPPIAVEERSAALKDIGYAEASGYISKATAATMAARLLDIETFDFDSEQEAIAEEFEHTADEGSEDAGNGLLGPDGKPLKKKPQGDGVIRRPMMHATNRQAPKLDPTKASTAEDQPPGLLMPAGESAPEQQNGNAEPGRSGFPADENPVTGGGASNIRKDNMRESMADVVAAAIREGARAGAKVPRRRPEDPEFQAAAERYRKRSHEQAQELLRAIHPLASTESEE